MQRGPLEPVFRSVAFHGVPERGHLSVHTLYIIETRRGSLCSARCEPAGGVAYGGGCAAEQEDCGVAGEVEPEE